MIKLLELNKQEISAVNGGARNPESSVSVRALLKKNNNLNKMVKLLNENINAYDHAVVSLNKTVHCLAITSTILACALSATFINMLIKK